MNPWPRHVLNVTNHALLRYLNRICGIDIAGIEKRLGQCSGPAMVLNVLKNCGVDVEGIRMKILDEANANKRTATACTRGFAIDANLVRYVVSSDGEVVTAYKRQRRGDGKWT